MINSTFRDGQIEDSIDQESAVGIIKYGNIDNWYFNIMSMLKFLQTNNENNLIEGSVDGEISIDQYNKLPNAYLCDKVDALLFMVKVYILFLQDHLYSLLTSEYDDIIDLHRSFVIRKILKEDTPCSLLSWKSTLTSKTALCTVRHIAHRIILRPMA